MARNYYETLGLPLTSTPAEIRTAYRKIVLQHHPDRSSDLKSKAIFLAATEAYQVLNDGERRKDYDEKLFMERKLRERRSQMPPTSPGGFTRPPVAERRPPPSARAVELREDIARVSQFFSRGRYNDAEELAQSLIERDPRQPVPYAILGDIARMRGNRGEALKLYAYAAQFDPRNPTYQRRYEELLNSPIRVSTSVKGEANELKSHYFAAYVGVGLLFVACAYLVLATERPLMPSLPFISTWTMGLIVMLFFAGVSIGASFSIEGFVDNFGASTLNSLGKVSPTVALGTIAIVNFWLALICYIALGLARNAFSISTTRLLAATTGATSLLALAAAFPGRIDALQVLLWGGNFVYIGSLCGWMVADAFRSPE